MAQACTRASCRPPAAARGLATAGPLFQAGRVGVTLRLPQRPLPAGLPAAHAVREVLLTARRMPASSLPAQSEERSRPQARALRARRGRCAQARLAAARMRASATAAACLTRPGRSWCRMRRTAPQGLHLRPLARPRPRRSRGPAARHRATGHARPWRPPKPARSRRACAAPLGAALQKPWQRLGQEKPFVGMLAQPRRWRRAPPACQWGSLAGTPRLGALRRGAWSKQVQGGRRRLSAEQRRSSGRPAACCQATVWAAARAPLSGRRASSSNMRCVVGRPPQVLVRC